MDAPVGVVKAYLELCGYFVLSELPLRLPDQHGYRDVTDIDIVAVRFPHSSRPMPRRDPLALLLGSDPELHGLNDGVDVIIGEVKAGHAHVNPALRRQAVVAFALRRLSCCPEPEVPAQAEAVAREGSRRMMMRGVLPCLIRLVVFAGEGEAGPPTVATISLRHCTDFIERRMREERSALAGAQLKDPVLALFGLLAKLPADAPREPPRHETKA